MEPDSPSLRRTLRQTLRDADAGEPSPLVASLRWGPVDGPPRSLSYGCASDAIFPLTSITKPFVAAATLSLVAKGRLTLVDRVAERRASFRGPDKRRVTIGDLLEHTSGLPYVTEADRKLRAAKATAAEFASAADVCPLVVSPGTAATYSNAGYSVLGALLEDEAEASLSSILRSEVFEPREMTTASLGSPASRPMRVAIERDDEADAALDWNSEYWQTVAAPWGGAFGTADDVAAFAQSLPTPLLTNPLRTSETNCWRLGFQERWPGHRNTLGDLVPPETVGHYGASGTLFWRTRSQVFVALTNRPVGRRPRLLQRLSNVVAASLFGWR